MQQSNAQRVAEEVRAAMARRRVTQTQVGQHLGIHQMSVSRRLSGETPFNIDELYMIADLLNVPIRALIPELAFDRASA